MEQEQQETKMHWQNHVRKISGSLYTVLPLDYCKAMKVEREDIIEFVLNLDGSLTVRFRKPKYGRGDGRA